MNYDLYELNRLKESPEIEPFFNDISKNDAAAAFYNTSHLPERAGSLYRCEYALSLLNDKAKVLESVSGSLARGATIEGSSVDIVNSWFDGHRSGLKDKYQAYFNSHSKVASSFIVGPSNFPIARNEKLSQYADNHYAAINEFRKKSIKRILRELMPHGDGNIIRTDDPKASTKINSRVEELEKQRTYMKLVNKVVRKYYKGTDTPVSNSEVYSNCITALAKENVSKSEAIKFLIPNNMGYVCPFEHYTLTNLGANIRRLKKRVNEVRQVQATTINDVFDNGIEVTISNDQKIVIVFSFKPDDQTRVKLKSCSFKWSRTRVAWVRKLTANAFYAYKNDIKPILEALT